MANKSVMCYLNGLSEKKAIEIWNLFGKWSNPYTDCQGTTEHKIQLVSWADRHRNQSTVQAEPKGGED